MSAEPEVPLRRFLSPCGFVERLIEEGGFVITRDGEPFAVVTPVSLLPFEVGGDCDCG